MNSRTLILSSARYYWRTHLGVILGAALGAMVLTGALLVGDAVKATLRAQALARIGKADLAMTGGDRFFRSTIGAEMKPAAASVLVLRGSLSKADGTSRINQAQVLGVDAGFNALAPASPKATADAARKLSVALNERAASQLGAKAGDTVILRIEKPAIFSRDAPLSGEEADVVALRMVVGSIRNDAEFGRFSLTSGQVPPFTVFASLEELQERLLDKKPQANLLLASGTSIEPFAKSVREHFKLQDASLELREGVGGVELRTPRVFLDPPVVAAAPPAKDGHRVEALTYFVNGLHAERKETPYSMVTAVDAAAAGFLPADLADNEIVLSQWEADDLRVAVGGEVTIKYYVMGERRQLDERERKFTVRSVLPMDEPQLNTSWMPEFPGLADKANCRDWKPGFDFDSTRMRSKDQDYWEKYKGTPKAFVTLKAGQEMWSNRWGNLTSIRWPAGTDRQALEKALLEKLTPEMLGFQFVPLREQALAATNAPVDFGELFVSFSFFLIMAAAVLTGMLFVFSLEQRNAEAGLLLALGLRPRQVRRLFLTEGAVLAVVGSVVGAFGGILYTQLVLKALATVWRGAVGAVEFSFVLPPATLATGVVSGIVVALIAIWLASRRQLRHSARELLAGEIMERVVRQRRGGSIPTIVAVTALVGGVVLLALVKGAEAFFSAGSLLLISGLAFALGWLRRLSVAVTTGLESVGQLGARNTTRRRGRSLATITVLASGVFMVVAVDSFRKSPPSEGDTKDPGTGGFALVGESSLPIYEDLNSEKGREAYGLNEKVMSDVHVIPLRVRDGDDASCLNLNRALQPRLMGLKPSELADRKAFQISPSSATWNLLNQNATEQEIPGIVDAKTLQWALQKKIGDVVEYRDDRGQTLRVKLVATIADSMLQGNVLIAEQEFVKRFPASGGYRYFLIDCPPGKMAAVRADLSRALTDRGLELTASSTKLAEFQAVENTYLAIFQALGGLGLLLGSAGLAIVVARNVLERRREFGLLAAVGFRSRQLRGLVFAEHRWLIVAALVIGTVSALVGVWPNLAAKAGGFPLREVAILLAALAFGCLFWTWLATRLALRGSGVAALRSE